MRTLFCAGTLAIAALATAAASSPLRESQPRTNVVCFKTGEQIAGQNKICYYNCLGSEAAITISAVSLCPLSINR